ncbi:hypothetical protein [Aliidiomarina quisquiliarum]|uniref:hypothetical protein n=1 Tax=Aliidiomarina quisquiliarum TaxID=2938947 RepID=UPI00208FB452|nr:hypothetical protein [Aliidiomarina quisquiliarum]MCO4321766.1 hypothetical protein [Aliidiomarina quisquiliarum]
MTSLFLISIWPAVLSRELLIEPVEVMGLSVQSWFSEEPNDRIKAQLKNASCLVLPEVQYDTWQCLTAEAIYSWDYSVQPSIWSESRRVGDPNKPYQLQWGAGELTVESSRQALYRIYYQVRQEAHVAGANIYLEQQFQGAFVYGWKRNGRDYVVTAWRNDDGNVLIVRLDREEQQ